MGRVEVMYITGRKLKRGNYYDMSMPKRTRYYSFTFVWDTVPST